MGFVFDQPQASPGLFDFDAQDQTAGAGFVSRASTGACDVQTFTGIFNHGFTNQPATLGSVDVTGFQGGLIGPSPYFALTGSVTPQGFYGGTQGKPDGLLDFASDPDSDPMSFEIITLPQFGTLAVEFNGAFLYTPNRGFTGTDSFTWRPWAAGEAGNVATVNLFVEEALQAQTGESGVLQGFPGGIAGTGLNAPATAGAVDVAGFAATYSAGFVGTATLGAVDVKGFVAPLFGTYQAIEGETDTTGFAGTFGYRGQALVGAVDVAGFAGTYNRGLSSAATTGAVDTTGFFASLAVAHGFTAQASLGETDTLGFGGGALTADLIAQTGVAGALEGLIGNLSFDLPPIVWSREPDPVIYYDPRNHLPDGQILDRETEDDLMTFWVSQGYRVLTTSEIETLVGPPLPVPVIRREFPTGDYPVRKVG